MDLERLKNANRQLWYLHFKVIPNELQGESDYIFGTKAAIYEVFTKDEVGITKLSLQNHSNDLYQNDKIILKKIGFYSKPTKRNNTKR